MPTNMHRLGRRLWQARTGALLLLATAAAWSPAQALALPPAGGEWVAAGAMAEAREGAAAALLPDGRVLVAGGESSSLHYLATSEIYDPTTNVWSTAASMLQARERAIAADLPDGEVLIAGGEGEGGYLASSEIYDPATNSWRIAAPMGEAREGAVAAVLPNGDVLVAGGEGEEGYLATSEIYDPADNSWSPGASMNQAREGAVASALPDGRVLVAGGFDGATLASSEVFNPASNSWSAAQPMSEARSFAGAATLPDGRVLIAGGKAEFGVPLAESEIYDAETGAWSPGGTMLEPRAFPIAAALPGGEVLLTGGHNGSGYLNSSELFYPAPRAEVAGGSFGDQTVAEPSPASVLTVTNIGAQTLVFSGASLSGANAAEFAITGDSCPGRRLTFGQSCTITVRFTPATAGAKTAGLLFSDNEPSRTTVSLSGTGIPPNSGPAGAGGEPGPRGPAGSNGAPGPRGAAGPRGVGARIEHLTCRAVKGRRAGRVMQRCTGRLTDLLKLFIGPGSHLGVALSRGKVFCAGGSVVQSHGLPVLLLSSRRGIGRGRYELTLTHGLMRQFEPVTVD